MGRRFVYNNHAVAEYTGPVVPDATTKGYWKFDNNSRDSYGSYHATTGTSITYVTGYKTNAASIAQGTDAAMKITVAMTGLFTGTDSSPITNNAGITMGGWFYKRTAGGSNQGLIYIGSTNTSGGFGLYIPNGTTNTINMLYGGLVGASVGYSMVDNTWTHIIYVLSEITVGGVYPTYVYINGQPVFSYTTQNPRKPAETFGMQIGCMSNNGTVANQQMYGYVDDIFLNKGTSWTAAQVLAYYNKNK